MKWARESLESCAIRGRLEAGYLMPGTISRKLGLDEIFGAEHLVGKPGRTLEVLIMQTEIWEGERTWCCRSNELVWADITLKTLFQVERHLAREGQKARKFEKERWRTADEIYGLDISLKTLRFSPIDVSKTCPVPILAAESVLGCAVNLPILGRDINLT